MDESLDDHFHRSEQSDNSHRHRHKHVHRHEKPPVVVKEHRKFYLSPTNKEERERGLLGYKGLPEGKGVIEFEGRDYSRYWINGPRVYNEFVPYIVDRELKKPCPSYPFNQKGERRLPWDDSHKEPVPTKSHRADPFKLPPESNPVTWDGEKKLIDIAVNEDHGNLTSKDRANLIMFVSRSFGIHIKVERIVQIEGCHLEGSRPFNPHIVFMFTSAATQTIDKPVIVYRNVSDFIGEFKIKRKVSFMVCCANLGAIARESDSEATRDRANTIVSGIEILIKDPARIVPMFFMVVMDIGLL